MSFGLYFHTIKFLKPIQFYGRVARVLVPPSLNKAPAPPRRFPPKKWSNTVERAPVIVGHSQCRFLNQEHDISSPNVWNDAKYDVLWLYNLHYFDDLNARDAVLRTPIHRQLMSRWLTEIPMGEGIGWHPYTLSLRIVNWIKWALSQPELEQSWLHSLAVQVRFLRQRLEYHLLGNHLFENAKALFFAGAFFDGQEANRWLIKGKALLVRELAQQVLADGGHFERSPMYHTLVLEGVLDLLQLQQIFPSIFNDELHSTLVETAEKMLCWLQVMTHPDGEIALFNDAAFGIAASPAEMQRYATMLELRLPTATMERTMRCRESGYVRLAIGDAVLIVDVGEIGPDHLPGHAHADTLSFELSVRGQRVIVDSGTSCYGISRERLRQRSTSAHNTVEVDSQSSSEVWSGFRVARRARPFDLQLLEDSDRKVIRCRHDGYTRLPGRVVHEREWILGPGRLTIRDRIMGTFQCAIGRYFVHPSVHIDCLGRSGTLKMQDGHEIGWRMQGAVGQLKQSSYHPEFGRSLDNLCLEAKFDQDWSEVNFNW